MCRKWLVGVILFLLLSGMIVIPVLAAETVVDQVILSGTSGVYPLSNFAWEITPDGQGNLIVSSDGGVIWKIDPLNGNYSLIDTAISGSQGLHGAFPSGSGYYFSDYINQIGFANPSNVYLWDIPPEDEDQLNHSIGRVNIDSNGIVWFIENMTTDSKIFNLSRNGSDAIVCRLIPLGDNIDYGTYAYDLDYYDGYLWWYNWLQERIVRLNPTPDSNGEYLMDYWDVPDGSTLVGGRENGFDAAGNFWVAGGGTGKLLRFNPNNQILTTFSAPGLPSVEGLTINGNQVWYANLNGSVGVLNSIWTTGEDANLASHFGNMKLKPSTPCYSLEASVTDVFHTQTGTLPFTFRTVLPDTSNSGWTIFPLSADDHLAGINHAQGVVLLSETNLAGTVDTGQLIRFIPPPPTEIKVFLPLIRR